MHTVDTGAAYGQRLTPAEVRVRLPALLVLAIVLPATADCFASVGIRTFSCMVPMQDGTRLVTDVYLPKLPRPPYPIILVRTPDDKDVLPTKLARYVCRHGFGLVIQETRGRQASVKLIISSSFEGRNAV